MIVTARAFYSSPWFTAGTVTTWNGLELAAAVTSGSTVTNVLHFISDGTSMIEVSRTTAM